MPIMSYLAFPRPGRAEQMCRAIAEIDGCEVHEATGGEVAVVLTDTPSKDADKAVKKRIDGVPDLACLTLVSAYADPAGQGVEA